MATISAVRDALKATIEAAVSGLRVHDTIPGSIHPPCALVIPERGAPRTLGAVKDTQEYRLRLYVGDESERTGQDALDAYLSYSGSSSIAAAIKATSGLGIAGVRAVVTGWENYGSVLVDEASYLSADVLITVEN